MSGRLRRCLAAVAIAVHTAAAAHAEGSAPLPAGTAFVHVNVVTMDDPEILRDRTVLVQDGAIAAVGKALPVPAGARIVDGGGTAYLSPGLADMHTHSTTKQDMAVYLANGVTTVLNMGAATPEFVGQVRPAIENGRIPGPHVVVAWRVDGSQRYGNLMLKTPDDARALVRLAQANGYAFVKVYNDLSKDVFDALIDEGRRRHMPVVGHGVTNVGILRQLAAGQVLVAHTEEFLYTGFPSAARPAPQPGARRWRDSRHGPRRARDERLCDGGPEHVRDHRPPMGQAGGGRHDARRADHALPVARPPARLAQRRLHPTRGRHRTAPGLPGPFHEGAGRRGRAARRRHGCAEHSRHRAGIFRTRRPGSPRRSWVDAPAGIVSGVPNR
jgi:hypothetical protein